MAIIDSAEYGWTVNTEQKPLTLTHIPYTDIYSGAEPNFTFHYEHVQESSIIETINSWGNILQEFYEHPWHLHIRDNADFIASRQLRDA